MTLEEVQCMIDDIDIVGRGLTDWEASYLDKMLKLTNNDKMPTAEQIAKLEEIYKARCR